MRARFIIAAATAVVALAACQPTGPSDSPATPASPDDLSGADGFPVTIEHAFGSSTIQAPPQRVATVAWSNHEVPLALGVVPVGMAAATWGDDDGDGVLPWVSDRLTDLGAETPVLFDETDGIDFEAVSDLIPDVILASYSGLSEEDYQTLSRIAPVVAYPETAWATSYEDMIRLSSTALGLAEEGEALIADLHADVEAALADHPELRDARVLFAYMDPTDFSQIGYYTLHDTRPGFLQSIGVGVPNLVSEQSATTESFYLTLSAEAADELDDVDLIVTYGSPDLIAQMQADPLLSTIPAVRQGAIAVLADNTPLAAAANPSPLSIPWGIADYLGELARPLTSEQG